MEIYRASEFEHNPSFTAYVQFKEVARELFSLKIQIQALTKSVEELHERMESFSTKKMIEEERGY